MELDNYTINNPNEFYYGSGVKIYDIEIFQNCYLYMDIDYHEDNKIINCFVLHPDRIDDLNKFTQYLLSLKGQIGFNNLGFDSQVNQFIISKFYTLIKKSIDEILSDIFEFSQETINKQGIRGFHTFRENELYTYQCDLYKIHHFDNMAKVQSLKGLQCNLNFPNVKESDISFDDLVTLDTLNQVIEYCLNDILSTKVFAIKSKPAIDLRKQLISLYNLPANAINWSDSKIGSELVLKFYCEHTNSNPGYIRKLRTKRDEVKLKDCIPNNVEFKTKEFNSIKAIFENTTLYAHEKYKIKDISLLYKGLVYEYGIGGIHASLTGVFESTEDELIYDIDVSSLYPSIAIANDLYPEHLGPDFLYVYKEKIVDFRLSEKKKGKEGNPAIVLGLKNAANSVYGKSNEQYSFLFDPKYTFSTTIIGQLQISMLVEWLCERIENCLIIQANTDGITLKIRKEHTELFRSICKEWEKLTNLELEEVIYKKMYIRDVNNYCAVPMEGKIKLKGCFEINKLEHKDPSFRIVPLAIKEYVVNGIPVEDTVKNHNEIWDFLGRIKFKSNSKGKLECIRGREIVSEETQKVTRYFISNRGMIFTKLLSGNRKSAINKSWYITVANLIENEKVYTEENGKRTYHYDVNHKFYIEEAYKIIEAVEKTKQKKQLTIF